MIHSLRTRLGLTHILPVLLLMPILSLYLLHFLEGFYTQSLLQQLEYQGNLLRNSVESQSAVMDDTQAAQEFLDVVGRLTDARVLLLSPSAIIMASTRSEDAVYVGSRLSESRVSGSAVEGALRGEVMQGVGPGLTSDVAYVVLPIRRDGSIIGALRVSYEVSDVKAQFNQLQLLILGGSGLTFLLALALSYALATTITRPLRELREGALEIAHGNYPVRVPANGRDELGDLSRSFNQMAVRLEEGEKARQRQLAAVTHEIGRPLAGVRAAVDTLRDGMEDVPGARDELMDGISEEIGRLQRLVETLQIVQKRGLRGLDLVLEQVPIEQVVHATLGNYEGLAAQKRITLLDQVPVTLTPVKADQDRLIQLLTNLLDNAFKFTPAGGQITVEAGEDDQAVWLSVSDTGEGIAAEELPFLFQEFYRGGSSQQPEKHGMGLGLTICREIVRAHGGTIWAESEPGKGARFTFRLPLARSPVTAAASSAPAHQPF
ncbi:MAG: sensor histidine kinase [Rudaea sp.]